MTGRCVLCGRVRDDVEEHHVGGRAHSAFTVLVCGDCHHGQDGLTAAQAPYQHLLSTPDLDGRLQDVLWDLDEATLLERLAARRRERARDRLMPYLHDPKTRAMLRRTKRRGT